MPVECCGLVTLPDRAKTHPRISFDLCPGTAPGEPVDADGCSAFQKDSDGDGLSDGFEALLGTDPALSDSDGDGLSDF